MTDQKTATTQAHSSISDEGADAHERPVEQPPAGGMLSGASLTEPASLAALCAEILELMTKATPGPWYAEPKRLVINGIEGPIMSYLAGNPSTHPGMTVSCASERIADHELIAALYNAAPVLLNAAKQNARLIALLRQASHWVAYDTELYRDIEKELEP